MTNPELHKQLVDREPEGEMELEEILWSSQYVGPVTVGGDTVYINREALNLSEEDVDEIVESGLVRSIPADVYLRNRGNTPVKCLMDYDAIQQELKIEVVSTNTPVLTLPQAVRSWGRYVNTQLTSPGLQTKLRGLVSLAGATLLCLLLMTLGILSQVV